MTGSAARIFHPSPFSFSSSPECSYFNDSDYHIDTKGPKSSGDQQTRSPTVPRAIPIRSASGLDTPPLTPDDGSDCSMTGSDYDGDEKDALDFLMTVFPKQGLSALSFAKRVNISAPTLGADFNGMVLELPGKPKTLYVDGKSAQSVSLRERCAGIL